MMAIAAAAGGRPLPLIGMLPPCIWEEEEEEEERQGGARDLKEEDEGG